VGTDGRERAAVAEGNDAELLDDTDEQLSARGDAQFAEQAVEVGVDRVAGEIQPAGNAGLFQIRKDAFDDLEFTMSHAQTERNLPPGLRGKDDTSDEVVLS
jgi:hypothetical protein